MPNGAQYPASGPGPTSLPPGVPGWLAPVIQLTTQVGLPTVIAGVLLWFVLSRIDGILRKISEGEDTRTKIVAAMQDTTIAALDRLGKRFEQAIDENIRANRDLADKYHYRPPGQPPG